MEIDYDALPNQFVLKPTNGSGDIVICKNKSHFNWEEAKRTLTNVVSVVLQRRQKNGLIMMCLSELLERD